MVEPPRLQVLGIAGSLRPGSRTRAAVAEALAGAAETGATTALLDLRALELPFVEQTPDYDASGGVRKLRDAMRAAQGIVLGTPEYHGSYSGVLKNALDLVGFEEVEGKMLGLVGVSGGALGATGALTELRAVGRALHAWVVPAQAVVPRSGSAFDASGRVAEPHLRERLREVGREVARFAFLHSHRQWHDFLAQWERAPPNPGGQGR